MEQQRVEQLQQKYGLSYHINFAVLAQQLVGLADKRVLEMGGCLPGGLVPDELGAHQWLALEEPDYWDETLSTGLVLGTPPPMTCQRTRFKDALPEQLDRQNPLYGRIEDLPEALHGHFDVVSSLFSPVWSAHDGYHLPEIMDRAGNKYNFGKSPIPPWGHLLRRPMEMYDYLLSVGCDKELAREVVYCVYSSNHINRFFLDDFLDDLLEIVGRSDFKVVQAKLETPLGWPQEFQQRWFAAGARAALIGRRTH